MHQTMRQENVKDHVFCKKEKKALRSGGKCHIIQIWYTVYQTALDYYDGKQRPVGRKNINEILGPDSPLAAFFRGFPFRISMIA